MAIQMRRGIYSEFDPARLVPGEWAVVLSGDAAASDGRAAYVCFAAGIVKRVATYEDMLDFFADAKDEAVEWIVNTANAGFKEEYASIRDDAKEAEAARVKAEVARNSAEESRKEAEAARTEAEEARDTAETERREIISNFETAWDAGELNGATFSPAVDASGNLSWSNDKGLQNPATVNIKGEKGNDGVVTQLAAGMYALQIEGTNLYIVYGSEAEPPDLSLEDDGHLYLEIGGQNA